MRLDRYVRRAAACLCTLTLLLTAPARSFGMEAAAESPAPPVFGSVRTEVMDSTSLFGPGRLTMLANHDTRAQMLSVIIETGQGGLIVVDGGWRENSEYLLNQIKAKGGHVQAWL